MSYLARLDVVAVADVVVAVDLVVGQDSVAGEAELGLASLAVDQVESILLDFDVVTVRAEAVLFVLQPFVQQAQDCVLVFKLAFDLVESWFCWILFTEQLPALAVGLKVFVA